MEASFIPMKIPNEVKWVRLVFYIFSWLIVIPNFVLSFFSKPESYWYLIPAIAYMLLLAAYPFLDYRPTNEFTQSPPYWGGKQWRRPAFILVSFVLTFWMSSYLFTVEMDSVVRREPVFDGLYMVLLVHLTGLLTWRTSLPACVLIILTAVAQDFILGTNLHDLVAYFGAVVGWSSILGIAYAMGALMQSRIASEVLVYELRATKQRLEESLQKEREVAVLRERNRLAREMHDVLGHALVLVSIKLEAAELLQKVNPEKATQEMVATRELVRQTMSELRVSLAEMRSETSEVAGKPLQEALKEWAEHTMAQTNLTVTTRFTKNTATLPVPVQDVLWRVGQEALLNVVKHARAKKVILQLYGEANKVILEVGDDGIGIPHLAEGAARLEVEGHYGIRGMRERLEAVGGQLAIQPNQQHGTLVTATVPLRG